MPMICNLGDMNKCRIHAPFAVAFLLSPKSASILAPTSS
jgi:hypothetical protein